MAYEEEKVIRLPTEVSAKFLPECSLLKTFDPKWDVSPKESIDYDHPYNGGGLLVSSCSGWIATGR